MSFTFSLWSFPRWNQIQRTNFLKSIFPLYSSDQDGFWCNFSVKAFHVAILCIWCETSDLITLTLKKRLLMSYTVNNLGGQKQPTCYSEMWKSNKAKQNKNNACYAKYNIVLFLLQTRSSLWISRSIQLTRLRSDRSQQRLKTHCGALGLQLRLFLQVNSCGPCLFTLDIIHRNTNFKCIISTTQSQLNFSSHISHSWIPQSLCKWKFKVEKCLLTFYTFSAELKREPEVTTTTKLLNGMREVKLTWKVSWWI